MPVRSRVPKVATPLLVVPALLVAAVPFHAQEPTPPAEADPPRIELTALFSFTINVRFVEAQIEYAGLDHLGPWVSLMTGASNGCEVVGVNEVGGDGGADRGFRGGRVFEGAATLTAGLSWAASTWFRPRIEYGYMNRAIGENGLALGFGMVF